SGLRLVPRPPSFRRSRPRYPRPGNRGAGDPGTGRSHPRRSAGDSNAGLAAAPDRGGGFMDRRLSARGRQRMIRVAALAGLLLNVPAPGVAVAETMRATGGLGVVVARASGSLVIGDRIGREAIGRVEGLGDLSHASVKFSPDERYAYVFGRDGGLTKVDLLEEAVVAREMQSGNAIGGAI